MTAAIDPATNRLQVYGGYGVTYDSNGNQLSSRWSGGYVNVWDPENRLVSTWDSRAPG